MKWEVGRQGTGYKKKLLLTGLWPVPFDCYLLKYEKGSEIPSHKDPNQNGRHYRLNIVIWKAGKGGEFLTESSIFESKRIKLFRPDIATHSVTRVEGVRYVLSIGWLRK